MNKIQLLNDTTGIAAGVALFIFAMINTEHLNIFYSSMFGIGTCHLILGTILNRFLISKLSKIRGENKK